MVWRRMVRENGLRVEGTILFALCTIRARHRIYIFGLGRIHFSNISANRSLQTKAKFICRNCMPFIHFHCSIIRHKTCHCYKYFRRNLFFRLVQGKRSGSLLTKQREISSQRSFNVFLLHRCVQKYYRSAPRTLEIFSGCFQHFASLCSARVSEISLQIVERSRLHRCADLPGSFILIPLRSLRVHLSRVASILLQARAQHIFRPTNSPHVGSSRCHVFHCALSTREFDVPRHILHTVVVLYKRE